MKNLKAWWNTRNLKPGADIGQEEMEELMNAVHFENSFKKFWHIAWTALIGICTIIAAVFSVLAYFK